MIGGRTTAAELTEEVQFTADCNGRITAVVLSFEVWQRVVEALEDATDRALVQALRSRLVKGPAASGALP